MRYFATTLLSVVVSGSAYAQQSSEYRTCDDVAKTQMAMDACASDEAARVDAQLNDVYRTLLQKVTDTTAAAKVKIAERAWLAYRDAYIDAMYPAENKQAEYGSVYPMEINLLRAKLTRIQIAALQDLSQQTGGASQSLSEDFASSVRTVKAKTHVPILLPSALPDPIGKAKHTVVESAAENAYAISLYYELGVGDSGFAASFSGAANPGYSPQELGNVSEVKLAQNLRGFFRPISCGGSCTPANLWWEGGGIVYEIQLKLPYSLDQEDKQKKTIIEVANSAILAGPR